MYDCVIKTHNIRNRQELLEAVTRDVHAECFRKLSHHKNLDALMRDERMTLRTGHVKRLENKICWNKSEAKINGFSSHKPPRKFRCLRVEHIKTMLLRTGHRLGRKRSLYKDSVIYVHYEFSLCQAELYSHYSCRFVYIYRDDSTAIIQSGRFEEYQLDFYRNGHVTYAVNLRLEYQL